MTISTREVALFVELEATAGTAETLVAADAILAEDLTFNPAESVQMLDRNAMYSSFNVKQAIYAGSLIGFQFAVELKGSGTAGTAPQALGDLLQACGMDETIVSSTSVTYAPISTLTGMGSVTIGIKQGGNYRIAKGCRGNVSFEFPAAGICRARFNMVGHISSESAASAPTPSYQAGNPPPFLDAAFTVASTEYEINTFTLDMQNVIAIPKDPNSADGFGEVRVTGRATQANIDPLDQVISTKDWIGIFRGGTTQAIASGVVGGTAGNRFALSIPAAYIRDPSEGDREGLRIWNLTLGCTDTDGTDDFALQFT